MKNINILLMAILLLASISCGDDKIKPHPGGSPLTDEVIFEQVGKIESIGLIEHYELLIQKTTESNADDNVFLEYLQGQLDAAEEYQEECINQSGANWDVEADGTGGKNRLLGYEYTTIRYKSIDHNGNPVMLSTLVVWPYNNIFPNPEADNVIIGCHVTYGSNAERPTNYGKNSIMSDVGMMACCAKSNGIGSSYENLVIIPDYQGFGATHGEVHPYLSQNLTARQVLDGVRAGIAYYKQNHKLEKNWKSVSTGYSQGGSVAMAVHRYIEKNNLESEFNFAGSVCGSGPYDPLATLQNYLENGKVYMPVSAAMMMYSMCETNPRLMGKYSPEDFLSEEFLESGVIDMIKEKKLNTDEMQEQLLQYSVQFDESEKKFQMYRKDKDGYFHPYTKDNKDEYKWESGYIRTAYTETPSMLEYFTVFYFRDKGKPLGVGSDKDYVHTKVLWDALKDNVLYLDWTPAHPIFLYHTEEDEVVVVDNYRNCIKEWEGSKYVKGAIYKGSTYTHVNYGSVFFMRHCGEGISAILDGKVDDYDFNTIIHGDL